MCQCLYVSTFPYLTQVDRSLLSDGSGRDSDEKQTAPGNSDTQRSQNMLCNFRKGQVDKLTENIVKTFQEVARNSAFTGCFLRRPTEFQMT